MNWRKLEPKVPQNKVSWVCHKGVKLHFKKFFKARKMGKDLEQKKASKGCGCGCRRCANHVGSGMHLPCTSDKRKKRRTGKKKTGGGRGCRGETRSTKNWESIDCEPEMKTRRNENSRTHHRCSDLWRPCCLLHVIQTFGFRRRLLVKWNTAGKCSKMVSTQIFVKFFLQLNTKSPTVRQSASASKICIGTRIQKIGTP